MKHFPTHPSYQGFTLIEIMVAVGIFALISVAAFQLLTAASKSAKSIEISSDRTAELQRAMLRIEQDIEQLAYRTTRNQFGDVSPLFRGESGSDESTGYIEFTRSGWRNPAGLPRSDLEHLVYKLDKGKLWRYSWFYLDRDHQQADIKRPILKDIRRIKIQFLKGEKNWQNQWATTGADDESNIPRAISIEFEFADELKLKRLFRLGVNDKS